MLVTPFGLTELAGIGVDIGIREGTTQNRCEHYHVPGTRYLVSNTTAKVSQRCSSKRGRASARRRKIYRTENHADCLYPTQDRDPRVRTYCCIETNRSRRINRSTPTNPTDSTASSTYNAARPVHINGCLLYTSPSPRDRQKSRMPSSA